MNTKTLAIVTIVAVTGALMLAALVSAIPTYAKITEKKTCDGEPGPCPGRSSDPGRGHVEDTENVNPTGRAPPGQNKD
jgi:hypothetical protein